MELFEDLPNSCVCGVDGGCVCSRKEQVVRLYASGKGTRAFTKEEREDLVSDANHAGEGFYNQTELETMNDQELAFATLNAWRMYVQSM